MIVASWCGIWGNLLYNCSWKILVEAWWLTVEACSDNFRSQKFPSVHLQRLLCLTCLCQLDTPISTVYVKFFLFFINRQIQHLSNYFLYYACNYALPKVVTAALAFHLIYPQEIIWPDLRCSHASLKWNLHFFGSCLLQNRVNFIP